MAVDSDVRKELEETRHQFQIYKPEMGDDANTLRQELERVQHSAASTTAELAKAKAKVDYLNGELDPR